MAYLDRKSQNEYQKAWLKQRYKERREIAYEILGDKCWNCGSTEQLEFDHINWRDKKIKFQRACTLKMDKFLEFLDLCQLLCKTCHLEKSREDWREQRDNRGKHICKPVTIIVVIFK